LDGGVIEQMMWLFGVVLAGFSEETEHVQRMLDYFLLIVMCFVG
tara:strand:- start:493 stop:624 length:132 start_codon:yes stop_codon:yes gene_type:complete